MAPTPDQHSSSRLNPKLLVKEVATGVHVDGGDTVRWGLVDPNGEPLSKKKVETASGGGFRLRSQCLDRSGVRLDRRHNGAKETEGNVFPLHAAWSGQPSTGTGRSPGGCRRSTAEPIRSPPDRMMTRTCRHVRLRPTSIRPEPDRCLGDPEPGMGHKFLEVLNDDPVNVGRVK